MRDFVKLSPKFWVGPTGRAIRKAGIEAQLVSLYLMSSPHATYTSIYHLPMVYIAADTGLSMDAVREALAAIERTGFARYDEDSECAWVVEGAKWQIGEDLKAADSRVKAIQKEIDSLPSDCPFKSEFLSKYGRAYHLRGASFKGQAELPAQEEEAPVAKKAAKAAATKETAAKTEQVPVAEAPAAEAPKAEGDKERAVFMNQLECFQAQRDEKGISSPAGDKRIASIALSSAMTYGYLIAANALYYAHEAGDHDFEDLGGYIDTAIEAAARTAAVSEEVDI